MFHHKVFAVFSEEYVMSSFGDRSWQEWQERQEAERRAEEARRRAYEEALHMQNLLAEQARQAEAQRNQQNNGWSW